MKKILWTVLMFGASSALKGLQANQGDPMKMTRLKVSLLYVQMVKTFRLLFMSTLSMGVCLVLLLAGIILLHVSLFLYAPWSIEMKLLVGLLSAVIYLSAGFVLFSKIFAADKWLQIFNTEEMVAKLNQEAPYSQKKNEQ